MKLEFFYKFFGLCISICISIFFSPICIFFSLFLHLFVSFCVFLDSVVFFHSADNLIYRNWFFLKIMNWVSTSTLLLGLPSSVFFRKKTSWKDRLLYSLAEGVKCRSRESRKAVFFLEKNIKKKYKNYRSKQQYLLSLSLSLSVFLIEKIDF